MLGRDAEGRTVLAVAVEDWLFDEFGRIEAGEEDLEQDFGDEDDDPALGPPIWARKAIGWERSAAGFGPLVRGVTPAGVARAVSCESSRDDCGADIPAGTVAVPNLPATGSLACEVAHHRLPFRQFRRKRAGLLATGLIQLGRCYAFEPHPDAVHVDRVTVQDVRGAL